MAKGFWRRAQAETAARVDGISWFKSMVVAEAVVLLLFGVALTIAPQITLRAVAENAAAARDISLSYRPAVAFFGLLLVAGAVASLWALLGGRRDEVAAHGEVEANTGPRRTRPAA